MTIEQFVARAVTQIDAEMQASIAASEARMKADGVPSDQIDAVRRLNAELYARDFPRVIEQIRQIAISVTRGN